MIQKSTLHQIILTQNEEIRRKGTGFPRKILRDLPDVQSHALIISGIRRCGKSTLLTQLLTKCSQDAFYLNFDDLRLADFSANDFVILDELISEGEYKALFFDEPQVIKQWERYVRQKLEEGFRVYITGSNASLLSRELGTHLTGRHITKELFPFSYSEFIQFKSLTAGVESFEQYVETGGFPEYVKSNNIDVMTELFNDILNRDIAVRHSIRDVASLKRLAIYLVSNVGNLVTANKLQQVFDLKTPTILEYFSFLEDTYLTGFVAKFSYSLKVQAVNPRKIYIVDSALQKAVSASFSQDLGRSLENIIHGCLRWRGDEIYYFNENGSECDFVVCKNGTPYELIQVCYELNAENREREQTGLKSAMDFFKLDNVKIITYGQKDSYIHDGTRVEIVPAWEYLVSHET